MPDSEVRRLQVRGSVRLTNYLQRRLHAEERARALVAAGHDLVESVWQGPARAAAALLGLLVLAFLVGSRELLTGRLPAVGQLAPFPRPVDPAHPLRRRLAHHRPGLVVVGPAACSGCSASPARCCSAGVGLLQKLLVLGAWPVAAVGAWRFGRHLGSPLARLVGVIAYLAVPLPYNSLARGQWGGLLAYAAAPWLLASLLAPHRPAPRSGADEDAAPPDWRDIARPRPGPGGGRRLRPLHRPGPAGGRPRAAARLAWSRASPRRPRRPSWAPSGAVLVAVVLLVPWSLELLLPGGWSTVTGVARLPAVQPGLGELLRFQVGPMGAAPLGWALLVVAAVPLVLGRDWRLAWAVRLWMVALTCVGVAWAGGQGWLPLQLQSPDVLLAFAAAALAGSAALGAVAFETDLRR